MRGWVGLASCSARRHSNKSGRQYKSSMRRRLCQIARRPQRLFDSFVINLRDRKERLQVFEACAQKAKLTCERVEAVDTRTFSQIEALLGDVDPTAYSALLQDVQRGHRSSHSALTQGAIGCALSHRAVSELGLQRNLPLIAVFEDDADLPADALARIDQCLTNAPADWDVILLGWSGAPPRDDGSALQRVSRFVGCHAYLLNARGMRALVELNSPVRTHVDHALSAGASSGRIAIYGVQRDDFRFRQRGRGSDVQQLPVRKEAGSKEAGSKEAGSKGTTTSPPPPPWGAAATSFPVLQSLQQAFSLRLAATARPCVVGSCRCEPLPSNFQTGIRTHLRTREIKDKHSVRL